MIIDQKSAKKTRLPLYWVDHVITNVFNGAYTRHYRDENNRLTFVVNKDGTDWSAVFPSAQVVEVDGASVVWIVFEKNKRHWYYSEKEAKA